MVLQSPLITCSLPILLLDTFGEWVTCALNINSVPISTQQMLDSWVENFPKKCRRLALIGCVAIIWTIWNTRNASCFQNGRHEDPAVLVFSLCWWLNNWTLLQKRVEDRDMLREGVKQIKTVALEAFHRAKGRALMSRRIEM